MAQEVTGSSPAYHPIFFARIPEVRFGGSPIFFALKVQLSAKNPLSAPLTLIQGGYPALNHAPPAFMVVAVANAPARCGLRPCVWLQEVTGLSRRNEMKPGSIIDAFVTEATAGNYDDLLATVMRYVYIE